MFHDIISEDIEFCHRRAAACAHEAASEKDPRLRRDFWEMERRWLLLAGSYEFSKRLNGYVERLPPPEGVVTLSPLAGPRPRQPFEQGELLGHVIPLRGHLAE